jgi:hypothetical protein
VFCGKENVSLEIVSKDDFSKIEKEFVMVERSLTEPPKERGTLALSSSEPTPIFSNVIISPEEQRIEPKENTKTWVANNYFSVGIDSKILLEYEELRRAHPSYFPHRIVNKGVIGLIGIKSMIEDCKSLRHYCFLKIKEPGMTKWKKVALPRKAKILVFLNIPSYSGGTNPWKQARNQDEVPEKKSQSISDGVLEIFAMEGAAHVALTIANLSGGIRIAQAEAVKLITLEVLPGHVDGEPYYLHPCKIIIGRKEKRCTMLINSPKDVQKSSIMPGGKYRVSFKIY